MGIYAPEFLILIKNPDLSFIRKKTELKTIK